MEARLVVLDGKQKGREIPLPETVFLIGRDPKCHLRPHCRSVSKWHCAIAAWAGRVRVRDLKSRNGTFLNGRSIDGECAVRDGDQLQVGTLAFAFSIKTKDGSPQTGPIEEDEVKWLLDAQEEPEALSISQQTCVMSAAEVNAMSDSLKTGTLNNTPPRKRRSKVVSAGQHLRDYFDMRKFPR